MLLETLTQKLTFMMNQSNFYYQVMSFELKNAQVTYQMMMEKFFAKKTVNNIEIYM